MEVIILSKSPNGRKRLHLAGGPCRMLVLAAVAGAALLGYGGYRYGVSAGAGEFVASVDKPGQAVLAEQRVLVAEAIRDSEDNLNALALRLGEMQAAVIRLDAVGKRLVEIANLDSQEFGFDEPPARGGPEEVSALSTYTVPDFLDNLHTVSTRLDDLSPRLAALESGLLERELQDEVRPAGRPITKGWMSSFYGYRTDPMSGKKAHHDGVDFAGRGGSDVVSVAAGVVTWSGRRSGYGHMVEIDHGGGYITRYAHNKENLVKAGDTVRKGQLIARMGSSGRSTGPHVHFEVLRNGKTVNPLKYVRADR